MLFEIFAYLLIGICAGTLSGLLGIGGGLIVVPALIFLFGMQGISNEIIMRLTAGTSLAAMIIVSLASMRAHLQRGVQIIKLYKRLVAGLILGTILGVLIASILHSRILIFIFGLMLIVVAFLMLFGIKPAANRKLPGKFGLFNISFLIGANSGMLGIGGGTITIPLLHYYNVSLRDAVGVSTAVSLTIACIGTISFISIGWHQPQLPRFSFGYVYLPAVIGIAIVSPFFAALGAAWSHRLPIENLRRIFALFLLAIGIKMLL